MVSTPCLQQQQAKLNAIMSTRLFVVKKQEQQVKKEMLLLKKAEMPVLDGIPVNLDNKNKPKIIKKPQPYTIRGSAVSTRT